MRCQEKAIIRTGTIVKKKKIWLLTSNILQSMTTNTLLQLFVVVAANKKESEKIDSRNFSVWTTKGDNYKYTCINRNGNDAQVGRL